MLRNTGDGGSRQHAEDGTWQHPPRLRLLLSHPRLRLLWHKVVLLAVAETAVAETAVAETAVVLLAVAETAVAATAVAATISWPTTTINPKMARFLSIALAWC